MIRRRFIPGSEWLYFKLYTGPKSADVILSYHVFPFSECLVKEDKIKQYFFIRYNDPGFHIRLRFLVSKAEFYADIFDRFYRIFEPLMVNGLLSDICCDTYNREIERYGEKTIEICEEAFYVDSAVILNVLGSIQEQETYDKETLRWKLALILIDDWLDALNFSPEERCETMLVFADNFKQEFRMTSKVYSKQINDKYRELRQEIYSCMSREEDYLNNYRDILEERKNRLAWLYSQIDKVINEDNYDSVRRSLAGSFIHMTMNRLFRTKNRIYELLLYDFITRYYKSQLARTKSA